MEHSIEYIDGIFIIRTSGTASVRGFIDAYKAIFTHPEWKQGSSLLFDHRQLTKDTEASHSYGDVSDIAAAFARYKDQIEGIRIASIKSLDPELATYFSLWDSTTKYFEMPIERREFSDFESALKWIKGSV